MIEALAIVGALAAIYAFFIYTMLTINSDTSKKKGENKNEQHNKNI